HVAGGGVIGGDSPSDIWVVGVRFTGSTSPANAWAVHWNGNGWTHENPPAYGYDRIPNAVAVSSARDVRVVGSREARENLPFEYRWNGVSWNTSSGPLPASARSGYLNGITAIPGTDQFWAVGQGTTRRGGTGENVSIILHCCS